MTTISFSPRTSFLPRIPTVPRVATPAPHRLRRHSHDGALTRENDSNAMPPLTPLTRKNLSEFEVSSSSPGKRLRRPSLDKVLAPAPISPGKRRRRPSLDELLSLPRSQIVLARKEEVLLPAIPSAASSDDGHETSSSGRTASTAARSTASSTESARLWEHSKVLEMHDAFVSKASHGGPWAVVAGKAITFKQLLSLEFPHLPRARIGALAAYASERAAEKAAAAAAAERARLLTWSVNERGILQELFERVDADGSGTIDVDEFISSFASGGRLGARELAAAWRAHCRGRAADGGGGALDDDDDDDGAAADERTLDFASFMALLEGGSEELFAQVRAVISAIAAAKARIEKKEAVPNPASPWKGARGVWPRRTSLLVHDGNEELWVRRGRRGSETSEEEGGGGGGSIVAKRPSLATSFQPSSARPAVVAL